MSQELKIAILPYDVAWGDKEENLLSIGERLRRVDSNTDIVVLPELFTTGVVSDSSMVVNLAETNQDKTTSIEMINFNKDGSCDYYTRSSSTDKWYMDDGYFDKSFYYTIEGNSIVANLGENKQYILKTHVTNDGELTLVTTENNYVDNQNVSFLKSSVDRTFEHYEMKGNRTISSGDIEVYSGSQKVDYDSPIVLNKNSTFDATSFDLYLKVNYKNDSFLKNVYVRFNPSMFSGLGISTAVVTPSGTSADFTYDGVNVELIYSVR